MAVSIQEVAEQAGVSRGTVSHVLNNRTSARIAVATQERVRRAAHDLGYRPNAIARSLRTQRTNIIGFYGGYGYLDARELFLAELIGGMQDGCNPLGKDLLLHSRFRNRSIDATHEELLNGRVDGVVLFTPPDFKLVELLNASSLPAVAVVDAVPSLPSVVVDDAGGARLLAEHLAKKGHRHVLYRVYSENSGTSSLRRLTAFKETALRGGMAVTVVAEDMVNLALTAEEHSLLTSASPSRPTAAVCWNDASAYRLLRLCPALGLRVPDDLAVVGFNGIVSEDGRPFNVTTIRAPWVSVGKTAISLVIDLIDGKQVPIETVLPVELMVGETT